MTSALRTKPQPSLVKLLVGLLGLSIFVSLLVSDGHAQSNDPDDFLSADKLIDRAAAYVSQEQWDKVIGLCTLAIKLKPDEPRAFYYRGRAKHELAHDDKGYQDAVGDFTEAIRLKPDYAVAYYARGEAYIHLKQSAKAMDDLREAIRLDPEVPLKYYDLLGCS